MYAVIKAGGRQERVRPGDVIEVDYMHADPGSEIEFRPLVVFDDDGKPHVGKDLAKARVVARLLGDRKGDKVKVFKYRPKSGYHRTMGHRQLLTLLEVEEVALSPSQVELKAEEAAEEAPAAKKPAAKAPAKKAPAKKAPAKKPAAKAAAGKAPAAKKPSARKPSARKPSARKPSGRRKA